MDKRRGYTLIELLVTLAVAAILLTIGVPASQAFIAKNRLAVASNQFLLSTLLARSEAGKRQVDVSLISANGKDWSTGWRVGVDANGDGDLADAGDQILRVYPALRGGVSLRSASAGAIVFSATGWATPASTLTASLNGKSRTIQVLASGRVTVTKP